MKTDFLSNYTKSNRMFIGKFFIKVQNKNKFYAIIIFHKIYE